MADTPRAFYEADSLGTEIYDVRAEAVIAGGPVDGDVAFYCRLAGETGGPVLDVGCGTGRVAVALAADGHDVVGLDLSAPMLRIAEQRRRRWRATSRRTSRSSTRTCGPSPSAGGSRSSSRHPACSSSCSRPRHSARRSSPCAITCDPRGCWSSICSIPCSTSSSPAPIPAPRRRGHPPRDRQSGHLGGHGPQSRPDPSAHQRGVDSLGDRAGR